MNLVRTRVYARLLMVVLLVAGFGLSACGNGTTFNPKKDTGLDSNNDWDVGHQKNDTGSSFDDTGSNGNSDSGGNQNPDADDNNDDNNPCLQTTADDAAAFAKDYAEALCQKMLSCERNPSVGALVAMGGWTDQESCVEGILAKHMSEGQARAAVMNNTMKLNSCEAENCLEEIGDLDCSDADSPYAENYAQAISSCYGAVVGKVSTGAACTIDGQCGSGEFCEIDDMKDVCGGTCQDRGQVGSGQCGTDMICRGDQYCVTDNNDNKVCVSRKADNEACEEDYECAYDSECDGGTCKPIQAGLDENAACDFMTALCKVGLVCVDDTCTVPGDVNDACEFIGCGAGLYCSDAEKCTERGNVGASCADDLECTSQSCVKGKCTDLEALCP